MKFKANFIVIPLIVFFVAFLGALLAKSGLTWYELHITKPDLTPPDWVFTIAWNVIYVLATASILIVYNQKKESDDLKLILELWAVHAFLFLLWPILFFQFHYIGLAFFELILFEFSILALIMFTWNTSRLASSILIPYALWVVMALYINSCLGIIN